MVAHLNMMRLNPICFNEAEARAPRMGMFALWDGFGVVVLQ